MNKGGRSDDIWTLPVLHAASAWPWMHLPMKRPDEGPVEMGRRETGVALPTACGIVINQIDDIWRWTGADAWSQNAEKVVSVFA